MKRRKRKRSSKAARPAKIPDDAGKGVGASVTGAEGQTHLGDEFIAPVEVKKRGSDPTALAEADQHTHPGSEFTAAVGEEKPAASSFTPAGEDRRTHPRYKFIAAVEVVATESGARIETRVRDLSQQGCYVDTNNALPLGTVTDE